MPTAEEYRLRFPDRAHAIDEIFREMIEPGEERSTLPDNVLGSAVPNPDAPTLVAPTLDLDPSRDRRASQNRRSLSDDFSAIT